MTVVAPAATPATPAAQPESFPIRVARRLEQAVARPWLLVGLLVAYVPFYVAYFNADLPFSLAHVRHVCGQSALEHALGLLLRCGIDVLRRRHRLGQPRRPTSSSPTSSTRRCTPWC